MNFGELKAIARADIWPDGEQENLIAVHNRYFSEAIFDIQKYVTCYQSNNTDVFRQCATFFNCGMTVLPVPRGHILSVSVIDKLSPYTGLEDPDADDDWCSRIYYKQVDYCHLSKYARLCQACSGAASLAASVSSIITDIFGVFRIKRRYPAPTDEGLESQPPLQQGYHYPQESTDADGRSPSGVFAIYRGRLYIAPWIQSTETVVIEWNGIKRTFSDADLVDDDPKFMQAVRTHVQWQHEKNFGDKETAKQLYVDLFGTPQTTGTVGLMMELIHECHEENRKRSCDEVAGNGVSGGGARGMSPTSGSGGTGQIFYNERQVYTASCPDGQEGDPITVVKEAGTFQSALSVADANAQAMASAQSEANSRLVCDDAQFAYYSTPQSFTARCESDDDDTPTPEGEPVTVTIPAGAYGSDVSQQAADEAALAAATAQAQAQLSCTYWNKAQTYTAECPEDTTGADVEKTVAAHTFSSTISQADADAKAMAEAQNQAETELSCTGITYLIGNTPQLVTVQYSCPGCTRTPVIFSSYTVPANTYKTMTTPATAAADLLSLNNQARAQANLVATANAQALCVTCNRAGTG